MAEALLSATRGGGWLESALGSLDRRLGGPARRRVIALLASVLALQSADFGTVGAVATQLEHAFHIHHAQLGVLASSSLLVGALATVPAGVLTDRVRRVRLLAGTIALWSVAIVAMGAAPSFGFEMVARLGLGAVGAAAGPAVASLTGDLFPRRERARIYGFVLTGELVGAAFGFLVSGNVAAALSWRFAFWVLAIPSAALAWALPRLLPEPARGGASRLPSGAKRIPTAGQDERHDEPEEESDDGEEGAAKVVRELGVEPDPDRVLRADPTQMGLVPAVRHILRIRTNVVLIAASALGYFFFAGLQTFAVAFLRRHFSLGQSLATTALVALGIGAVAGVLAGGRVADRALDHGRVEARVVVPAVAYAAAALILAPAILTPSLLVAMPLYLLAAAALAAPNPPLDAARLDIMPSRLWGRAEGVRTVLRQLAQAAAPVAFGATADAFGGHGGSGLQYAFLIMLIPLGVSGVIVWRGRRSYPRDVATALASEETIARRRASPQPGEDAGGAPRRTQPRAGRFSHQRPRHG